MADISNVPANNGTAPKAPEDPTWSSRMAVCGLHFKPNKKSSGGTALKKRMASNTTERTIPTVVTMAIRAGNQKHRHRRFNVIACPEPGRNPTAAPQNPGNGDDQHASSQQLRRQRPQPGVRSAATCTASEDSPPNARPSIRLRISFSRRPSRSGGRVCICWGSSLTTMPVMMLSEQQPTRQHDQSRYTAPQRREQAGMRGANGNDATPWRHQRRKTRGTALPISQRRSCQQRHCNHGWRHQKDLSLLYRRSVVPAQAPCKR